MYRNMLHVKCIQHHYCEWLIWAQWRLFYPAASPRCTLPWKGKGVSSAGQGQLMVLLGWSRDSSWQAAVSRGLIARPRLKVSAMMVIRGVHEAAGQLFRRYVNRRAPKKAVPWHSLSSWWTIVWAASAPPGRPTSKIGHFHPPVHQPALSDQQGPNSQQPGYTQTHTVRIELGQSWI